jgi:uncharacterized protein
MIPGRLSCLWSPPSVGGWCFAISVALLVVLTGCASTPPSRFYTLSAMPKVLPVNLPADLPGDFSLGVGPVNIPQYLDREQIVTRVGENELVLAEFDRLGGDLAG